MRPTVLLFAVLLCPAAPALAQVTIDLRALDALPGGKPPQGEHPLKHHAPTTAQARPRVVARHTPSAPAPQQATATPAIPPGSPAPVPAEPATPSPAEQPPVATGAPPPSTATAAEPPHEAPTPPAATLPVAPPAVVALAPIPPPPPPQQAAPPPAPPPISSTATSAATPITGGLQLTFGTGQTDLSAASATAIEQLVNSTQATDSTTFNVVAYAAGTPEDPSTPRRLSLSRALAVRSALIAGGVSSSRIYVRALGSTAPNGPADRVDLTVLGANLPSTIPTSGPPQPPARQSQQP